MSRRYLDASLIDREVAVSCEDAPTDNTVESVYLVETRLTLG